MKLWEKLKAIRAALRAEFQHSVYDAAEFTGLAIEYPQGIPAKHDGHLDPNDKPRFIAVNPDLSDPEQVYVIARELARYAQLRGGPSMFVNRPWKSNLLLTAPTETRDLIYKVDLEVRAHFVMAWHSSNKVVFAFYKRHPKKLFVVCLSNGIFDFIFLKLRVRNYLYRILSILRFVKG